MKTYILLEYKRDITITKLGDKLVNAATRDQQQDIDTIITALEQMDPTTNKQYVEWLARQYIKQQFRLEDYPRVNDVLVKFEQIKNKLEQKDINQYTFKSLEEVIDKEFNVELKDEVGDTDIPGAKNLYNGPLGRLDVPRTEEAAKILGKGTKWCTAAEKNNMFERYNNEGPLYVWRDKSGDKYQFHFETMQFMDSRDNPIDHELIIYFRTDHPVLSKMFKKGEEYYLTSADRAYKYAQKVLRGQFKEGETAIASDQKSAYFYSLNVINGPFKKGEPIIATNAELAYRYARDVIKGPFKKGEPIIATNSIYAYCYARDIIKDKWIEGESKITTDSNCAYLYAYNVIKDRFPEGEKAIASNSYYAYRYAHDVIKGKFPEGEQTILNSKFAQKYRELLNSSQ
jgi:hypothetical protein